jgi:hypothetical protein
MKIDFLKETKLISNDVQSINECDLSDGFFSQEDCTMEFQVGNDTLFIYFDLYVEGAHFEEPGDYFVPSTFDTVIDYIDIQINEVYINDEEKVISDDLNTELIKLVKSYL